ncbi:tigger transposable element-derived protein 4-like [Tetranychus urticae]|uniref:tigger transposable element-derived protein 4-like n=1 Tax=Tetranychus urticae TaxID=32264 RepID=UPI00077BD436|nr:tigger transposable element-derived protein 4-like [Tetranychus urticae]
MKSLVDKTSNLDSALLSFVHKMNKKTFPISSQMICQKAIELSKNSNFKASNGWFERFRKRCNIKFGTLSGEAAAVDQNVVENFKLNNLPLIVRKYPPDKRCNVDETSLFYRQLPSKTFFIKKNEHFGNKLNKERISILLGCNQSGEKMLPLIITKSKNPRSLRGRSNYLNQKGLLLESNKAAWMTKEIFFNYIKKWHVELEKKGDRIALILDNFAGHKVDEKNFPLIEFFGFHQIQLVFSSHWTVES